MDSIRWGVVLGKIEEIELPDDGYDGSQGLAGYSKPVDYMLVDCAQPAQPAAVPVDEQEPAAYLHRMEKTTELSFWGEDAECTGRKDWIGCAPLFLHRDKGYLASFAQPSAVPDGWQIVPKEPTPEMVRAADDVNECERKEFKANAVPGDAWGHITFACAYRAMLAAAPQPDNKENGNAE